MAAISFFFKFIFKSIGVDYIFVVLFSQFWYCKGVMTKVIPKRNHQQSAIILEQRFNLLGAPIDQNTLRYIVLNELWSSFDFLSR